MIKKTFVCYAMILCLTLIGDSKCEETRQIEIRSLQDWSEKLVHNMLYLRDRLPQRDLVGLSMEEDEFTIVAILRLLFCMSGGKVKVQTEYKLSEGLSPLGRLKLCGIVFEVEPSISTDIEECDVTPLQENMSRSRLLSSVRYFKAPGVLDVVRQIMDLVENLPFGLPNHPSKLESQFISSCTLQQRRSAIRFL